MYVTCSLPTLTTNVVLTLTLHAQTVRHIFSRLACPKGRRRWFGVAGPLSGLIVQPIIGVVADESTSKWGRRRPIIAIGSVIVALSLLVLGFTKELVESFISDPDTARALTIMMAVLSLYSVDFSINAGER